MSFIRYGAMVLALVAVTSAHAHAQGFGRTASQPYNGGVSVINPPNTMPMNVLYQVKEAWKGKRLLMTDAGLAWLRDRDIGNGFRTSRNRLNIADDGRLYVSADSRGFTFRFALVNNVLTTYLSNPSRLGNEALFITTFDLDIAIDVNVSGNQLVASPARIQATVRRPAGENTTGMFAVASANIVRALSSSQFAAALLSRVNAGAFGPPAEVTNTLARVNPLLRRASSVTGGYDPGTGNITLTLRR